MSQRDGNFKGGIQKGTVAADAEAIKLDNQCKDIRYKVLEKYKDYGITLKTQLKAEDIPNGGKGCNPDGGLFYLNEKLIAVFEGKKQGKGGNAIERWPCNKDKVRAINENVSYVTFCVGPGASPNGVMENTLKLYHPDGFNKFVPEKNSSYFSVDGFSDEFIEEKMCEVLEWAIKNKN
jgi:hypothetical protein